MINRYPLWKYLLICFVLAIGVIYAMPNFYSPDPAIQVSGESGGMVMEQSVADQAAQALAADNIDVKAVELNDTNILIRLAHRRDQLMARSLIEHALGVQYVVALNLAPTTPQWLVAIGAAPMKLGLDLSGGVHFLLEVDTQDVVDKRLQGYQSEIRRELRLAKLPSRQWRVETGAQGQGVLVIFPDQATYDAGVKVIAKEFPQLNRQSDGANFNVRLRLNEQTIQELEDYAVTQNLTSLRNRVNELGVSEPVVQRQGRSRIVVELPGIQDTAQAKRIIGKTANLEFRLGAKPGASKSTVERFPFKNDRTQMITLQRRIIVTGDHVTQAHASFDSESGVPQVNITLDSEGGKKMHRATRKEIGQQMGVLFIETKSEMKTEVNAEGEEEQIRSKRIEKNVINFATIQDALGVQFRITGLDSPTEAAELALLLRAGALAAPINFVEERTVGPSLGAENIQDGIKSVEIGLALVMLFMLVYYKVFGVAAVTALSVNLVLLVAVMSMLGATLTLPGIAGIVLTVGMAVDANVLIFSRIKEELRNGLSSPLAIEAGYNRAFVTILDANLTTLLVALILYAIGSGPIQGFAVTLSIGIVTSMFTAIMLTRAIINVVYGGNNVKKLWI